MTGHIKLQTMSRYNKNSASFIQRELNEKTPGQTGHINLIVNRQHKVDISVT